MKTLALHLASHCFQLNIVLFNSFAQHLLYIEYGDTQVTGERDGIAVRACHTTFIGLFPTLALARPIAFESCDRSYQTAPRVSSTNVVEFWRVLIAEYTFSIEDDQETVPGARFKSTAFVVEHSETRQCSQPLNTNCKVWWLQYLILQAYRQLPHALKQKL